MKFWVWTCFLGNLCPDSTFLVRNFIIDQKYLNAGLWFKIEKLFYIFFNGLLSNIKKYYYENSMCNRIENSSKLKLWSVQKKKFVVLFFMRRHFANFNWCKFRNEQISECENSTNYVLNLPVILVETCFYFKQESIN